MLFHGLFPAAWCHFKALTMAPGNIYMRKLVVYTTRTRIDNARTMFCKITNRNINKKNIHELLTHVWWTRDALLAEGSFRCFDLMMLESYRMIKDKYFSVQNPVRKHFKSASQHCWKPSIPNQISPAFGVNLVFMQGTNMKRIIWKKDKIKGICPNLARICII